MMKWWEAMTLVIGAEWYIIFCFIVNDWMGPTALLALSFFLSERTGRR